MVVGNLCGNLWVILPDKIVVQNRAVIIGTVIPGYIGIIPTFCDFVGVYLLEGAFGAEKGAEGFAISKELS